MMSVRTRFPNNEKLDALLSGAPQVATPFGAEWNELPWVGSGGCAENPHIALVFINPTARNQSAAQRWVGERAPFIGLRRIWRALASAGLLEASAVGELPADGQWTMQDASDFYKLVAERGLYVTNLVKACRDDSTLPSTRMAKAYCGLMVDELTVVRARRVVGMGALVTSILSGQPVKMEDEYQNLVLTGAVAVRKIPGSQLELSPSYFPVGRGNPARARVMLSAVAVSVGLDSGPIEG